MSIINPEPSPLGIADVYDNTSQVVIRITEDRLKNYLTEYLIKITKAKAWITPMSILLTLIIATVTSNFVDAFGISASIWSWLFKLCIGLCSIWLIIEVFRCIYYFRKFSVEKLLYKIKNG